MGAVGTPTLPIQHRTPTHQPPSCPPALPAGTASSSPGGDPVTWRKPREGGQMAGRPSPGPSPGPDAAHLQSALPAPVPLWPSPLPAGVRLASGGEVPGMSASSLPPESLPAAYLVLWLVVPNNTHVHTMKPSGIHICTHINVYMFTCAHMHLYICTHIHACVYTPQGPLGALIYIKSWKIPARENPQVCGMVWPGDGSGDGSKRGP